MNALIHRPIEVFDEGSDRTRVIYVTRSESRNGSLVGTFVLLLLVTVLLIFAFAVGARLMRKYLT